MEPEPYNEFEALLGEFQRRFGKNPMLDLDEKPWMMADYSRAEQLYFEPLLRLRAEEQCIQAARAKRLDQYQEATGRHWNPGQASSSSGVRHTEASAAVAALPHTPADSEEEYEASAWLTAELSQRVPCDNLLARATTQGEWRARMLWQEERAKILQRKHDKQLANAVSNQRRHDTSKAG